MRLNLLGKNQLNVYFLFPAIMENSTEEAQEGGAKALKNEEEEAELSEKTQKNLKGTKKQNQKLKVTFRRSQVSQRTSSFRSRQWNEGGGRERRRKAAKWRPRRRG